MRRVLLILSFYLVFSLYSSGERINVKQAQEIAQLFLSNKFPKDLRNIENTSNRHTLLKPLSIDNKISDYHTFSIKSTKGFVIVSGSDKLPEIVGYSLESNFNPDSLPDALKAYLSDYAKIVSAIEEGKAVNTSALETGVAVEPLIKAKWDQDSPFNDLTPDMGSSKALTGCVATAAAQVMYFHKFPTKGKGTVTTGGLSVTLGHLYEWDKMLPDYKKGFYSEEEGNAVATLMRDVGYAVEMNYGKNVSSAHSSMIVTGLCRNFNYSPEAMHIYRASCSSEYWTNLIRESLLRKEPVPYAGDDYQTAHQFVCDGIDENNYLHINWGWGGLADGYFDMNILSPDNLGAGAGNGAYFHNQSIILNLRPGNEDADQSEYRASPAIFNIKVESEVDKDGVLLSDVNNVRIMCNFANETGNSLSSFTVGTLISDDSGQKRIIGSKQRYYNLLSNHYLGMDQNVSLNKLIESENLKDGHYTLSIVYSYNDLSTADYSYPNAGDFNNIGFSIKGKQIIFDRPAMANTPRNKFTILSSEIEDIYQNCSGELNCTIKCEALSSYSNITLNVYLIPESDISPDINISDYKRVGSISRLFYDGTYSISGTVDTEGLKPGKYAIYLGYFHNFSSLTIVPSETTKYVTIKPIPDGGIVAYKAFAQTPDKIERLKELPYQSFYISYYNNGGTMPSSIELWGYPEGESEESEFFIGSMDSFTFQPNKKSTWVDFVCDNTLWHKELGRYVAYIKYKDKQGKMIRMLGSNNCFSFELIENDDLFYLTSPMIVNHGEAITTDGTSAALIDVDFELAINTPRIINENFSTMALISSDPFGMDRDLYKNFQIYSLEFENTEFQPGQPVKCHTKIYFNPTDFDNNYGKTFYVVIETIPIKLNEGELGSSSRNVQVQPFLESTSFSISKTSHIEKPAPDNTAPIEIYSINGMRIPISVSSQSELHTNLTPGVYIIRQGKTVSKIAIK